MILVILMLMYKAKSEQKDNETNARTRALMMSICTDTCQLGLISCHQLLIQ